ncbi:MAG TPA: AraC family transcriptional regulator [bacterium]|nr:AraC family transcriptional regulator [bacterium]
MKKGIEEKVIKKSTGVPILIREDIEYLDKGHSVFLAYHQEVEIHIIKEGKGFYLIQNKKYIFDKNTAIIIYPDQQHLHNIYPPYSIKKISLYFNPGILKKINFDINSLPHLIKIPGKNIAKIQLVVDLMKNEISEKKKFCEDTTYSLLNFILNLLKRWKYEKEIPYKQADPLIDKLIEYLNENYYKDIDILHLSKIFYKSESYLSHIFKKFTGIGIKEYIIQKRILESKKILENQNDIKITKVGEKVGFSSFPLFYRAFKKITGISPSSYRDIFLKAENNIKTAENII